MFRHSSFSVEPWAVTESTLDLEVLAQSESILALSNGHIGMRGNLDEGEPHGLPGTYLNSVYELRPLPYPEPGFGYPEADQTVVNVTNGKVIRLLVDDEPFDVRYGELVSHVRTLDLQAGVLRREVQWRSPAGTLVRVSSTRLVSFAERAVAAISYSVEPLERSVQVVLQSELVANEPLPPRTADDPRVSESLDQTLEGEESLSWPAGGLLVHRVRRSGILLAAAMEHDIEAPEGSATSSEASADVARVTVVATLEPSQRVGVTKFLAYGWSTQRSRPALHDQVRGAVQSARQIGWEGLAASQRAFLEDYWSGVDVELDGDPEIQQAVRFSLFHVLQAGARAEGRPIPAKGLTGPGYDGHAFWDTEIYVLGLLGLSRPEAVADALRWRHSTLPRARARARQLGFEGAAFPWRTIDGQECSGYWPASTAAFHVAADVAYAVVRYVRTTGDVAFEAEVGLELLVETARLWRSLGHHHTDGSFRIDGVTGPDEYSALADNNVYTNLMAQLNLHAAADVCVRHRSQAAALGVGDEEISWWRDAARDMFIPYDERLGVHPQAQGFTDHEVWDFARTRVDQYPLMLHFHYFDLYRKQVVKQSDLVLAMHLRPEAFSAEDKERNFTYYEPITVRDSSLSACTQAVIGAETGHLGLAYDYVAESSLIDLDDLEHNTRDGLHMAALAGAWTALVEGLGGVRIENTRLVVRPRIPEGLQGLRFRMRYQGRRVQVDVRPSEARYQLLSGDDLSLWHHDEELLLRAEHEEVRPISALPARPAPAQPPGREPGRGRAAP